MQLSIGVLLLATIFTSNIQAKPLPANFFEVERRWSQGQSEAQIHATHHIREASPAWAVNRDREVDVDEFQFTTDERTMRERSRWREQQRKRMNQLGLLTRVKDAIARSMPARRAGTVQDDWEEEEAPVLKPRRGIRYLVRS
ncbi:hypothetical protein BAUCODRAFT_146047 [Baudoinia panamericana UAMH 10762]|uniref:Uncharacterized protein n=1 Tax=Baudoinia panamericana (strain UAMH 10762) TaxID=717646 RepID=M2MQJ3_BAUPA|nr:uncharacterized protein BAUCODRAFT_146047 [Baudoinia panamericana UAMH 10762]EMC99061.1 hypothetical protein BAUCODRAFT_146047 [Baudoinia panamericana UAMH 10762]